MELLDNKIKLLIKLFYRKFYGASIHYNIEYGGGFILEKCIGKTMKAARYILF